MCTSFLGTGAPDQGQWLAGESAVIARGVNPCRIFPDEVVSWSQSSGPLCADANTALLGRRRGGGGTLITVFAVWLLPTSYPSTQVGRPHGFRGASHCRAVAFVFRLAAGVRELRVRSMRSMLVCTTCPLTTVEAESSPEREINTAIVWAKKSKQNKSLLLNTVVVTRPAACKPSSSTLPFPFLSFLFSFYKIEVMHPLKRLQRGYFACCRNRAQPLLWWDSCYQQTYTGERIGGNDTEAKHYLIPYFHAYSTLQINIRFVFEKQNEERKGFSL